MIRRREFITLLGAAAAAWPLAALAQNPTMPVIGFLNSGSPDGGTRILRAFRQGLGEFGYIEGENVAIEYRWAEDQTDRLLGMAADLVRRRVAVIAATGAGASTQAAKSATATIPIVFYSGQDPVQAGLIASLNRPGGNLTGVATLGTELGPKRLELLHESLPSARVIAMLVSPANPNAEELQAAAVSLGLQIHFVPAATERDLEAAFARIAELRVGGLWIGPYGVFVSESEQLAALALRHAVPAISPSREFAAAGGLMSYGDSDADQYRRVGVYVGRILKGAKPADLPVQQATRVELAINLKTAKALGITVPITLLGRADEVIE
jgi:putative ABC transport system substrate-binding protein